MFTFSRGYAERQKIMAVLVEGQFMEIFLTPQNLGGGGCIPLDVAVVSITLLVTGGLIGSRFNHLYYMLTPPPRDIYTYNNSTKTLFELAHILVVFAACTFCDASSTNESRPPP